MNQELLKSILNYNPDTGEFIWAKRNGKMKEGAKAGAVTTIGYVYIMYKGKGYCAHRLAWMYMHGDDMPQTIDHINGIRDDNRLCNLRPATMAQQHENKKIPVNNKSGYIGVSWYNREKKWVARIKVNKKQHNIGYFDDVHQAAEAYKKAKRQLHTLNPEVPENRPWYKQ